MIKGQKVILRAIEHSDLKKIWEWENDSEVMEFASTAPDRCAPYHTVEQMFSNGGRPNGPGENRYMILDEDERSIGMISYWVANPRFSQSAELGIYLGEKDLWRRGYGTDAVMTLAYVLFMNLGFHRLGFATGGHNFRVQKVFEKWGVKVEGIIREERFMHGRYYDTVRMGLLKDEFEEKYQQYTAASQVPELAHAEALG